MAKFYAIRIMLDYILGEVIFERDLCYKSNVYLFPFGQLLTFLPLPFLTQNQAELL